MRAEQGREAGKAYRVRNLLEIKAEDQMTLSSYFLLAFPLPYSLPPHQNQC